MSMQKGLFALLAADAGVTALVNGAIYAGEAPDQIEAYPCVAYKLVGGSVDPTVDTSGVYRQRIELNGFSFKSYAEADQIRQAIIAAVDGWQQQLGDGTVIETAFLVNPGSDSVSEQRCFRCMCEFAVLYARP